jgi:hypothetical protein
MQPSNLALDVAQLPQNFPQRDMKAYPSPIVQKSPITQPITREFLPMTQCEPMIDFFTVARSATRVELPSNESADMDALGSISSDEARSRGGNEART